ncbi:MAG: hypothetical protein Q7K39_04965 [Candidatus Magasanikbacteria bacterium]|nr:hypothetical protein [Candidatus Magasanikbacteria bacterium]
MLKKINTHLNRHYHRRYHGIYRHAKQLFVFDMALLAAAVSLLGVAIFLFFWKPGLQNQIALSLSLGNGRIKSGEAVHLTVDYVNNSKFILQEAALALRLPKGFLIDRTQSSESYFSKQNTVALPDVLPGAGGRVDLYGWLWTEFNAEENIIASLSYVPEKTDRREQKLGSYLLKLPESILSGQILTASSSLAANALNYTFNLTNNSEHKIERINLVKSWRGLNERLSDWNNLALAPGETKQITGSLMTPLKPDELILTVSPVIEINNYPIKQNPATARVKIIYPDLGVATRWLNPPSYGEPKQVLPIELSWRNNSPFNLTNAKIILETTPGVIDLFATAKNNNLKIENGKLVIDGKAKTSLATAEPGASDIFNINIYLADHFLPGQTDSTELVISPVIEAGVPAVSGQRFAQGGTTARLKLATDVQLSVASRYYTDEGDQLGRGPLPPQVGSATKYWIWVQIYNSTNKVRDAAFAATLPSGVRFTGKQSITLGPPLKFDTTSQRVSWSHYELLANSVTGLYFEVEVIPTPEQAGSSLILARDMFFTGTDDAVGREFSLSRASLSNVLPATDRGAAKGAIVR